MGHEELLIGTYFFQALELTRNNVPAFVVSTTPAPTEEELDTIYDYDFVDDEVTTVPASWTSNVSAEAEAVQLFFSLPVDVR